MKRIYITGVSGTGKTTLARELERRGHRTISIDEVENLCSWVSKESGEKHEGENTELTPAFVDAHDWVLDTTYLKALLGKDETVFVLGLAGNQHDFLHLFDTLLLLECSPEIFIKRIDERTDNDFGKDLEIQKQITALYESYGKEMRALGATVINTEKPVHDVADEVLRVVGV